MSKKHPGLTETIFSRFLPSKENRPSKELKVAVIGGGPAGLLLAWKLLDAGHKVHVFEKRKEYQLNNTTDERSYNLTADGLGLRSFGRLSKLIYLGGTVVDGRAIHAPSSSDALWTHHYGRRASDHLVSIPRGDLLAVLASTISGHPKYEPRFKCEVTKADTRHGKITYTNNNRTQKLLDGFDLIAFADGVQGIGQGEARKYGHNMDIKTHPTPYLTATITKNAATEAGLDLTKIHFFPGTNSLGIGLPNHDGTISLLIEGIVPPNSKNSLVCPFTGRVFKSDQDVFTAFGDAQNYLQSQNRKLASVLKDSVNEILNKRPGRFIQSSVSDWRISKVGVLVGDAGSCAPPWAGFGMNLACSHADDLARLVADKLDNLNAALEQYNHRRIECTKVVASIIEKHGALLTSGMALKKWRHEEMLRDRREQILDERSEYQRVAFDERGLEMLAGLE